MDTIIVIGASAGGVEAVTTLVRNLPATINAAVFVVVHFPAQATSVMPYLLNRSKRLPARHATDGEAIEMGQVYIAPPDWHMLVEAGKISLTRGPHENRHRPAIDPLFRSAALAYGGRVAGVLLSGMQDDGTAGLQAIKARGGITICQDPNDAIYPDMPRNAIEQVGVDYVLPLAEIAPLLTHISHQAKTTAATPALINQLQYETKVAALDWEAFGTTTPPGQVSSLACPTCGGVLWELEEDKVLRYRCRVGHAFAPHDLLSSQENQVENALWTALRALEERGSLLNRMAERAENDNRPHATRHLQTQKEEAYQRASLLHNVLMSGGIASLTAAAATNALPAEHTHDDIATDTPVS